MCSSVFLLHSFRKVSSKDFCVALLPNHSFTGCSKNAMMPIVGCSHNVSFTRPYGLFDVAAVTIANSMTLFPYVDSICDKLDFIGINYYGQVS
jgi:hypothetical protein